MNTTSILSLLAIVAIFVNSWVESTKVKEGCIKPTAVELSEKWIEDHGTISWWAPLGSKLERVRPGDADTAPPDNRTFAKKTCWAAVVSSPMGTFPYPLECKYNDVKDQNCEMYTQYTPIHKYIRYFGDFTATLTDNKSYVVAVGCLLGKNDYWIAMSVHKELDNVTKELILSHIETMGFNRTRTALMSDRDYVYIKKVWLMGCKKPKSTKSTK